MGQLIQDKVCVSLRQWSANLDGPHDAQLLQGKPVSFRKQRRIVEKYRPLREWAVPSGIYFRGFCFVFSAFGLTPRESSGLGVAAIRCAATFV